ncbi:MAG: dihydroneopterin aldolase [Rhabdaerophilum sp.]
MPMHELSLPKDRIRLKKVAVFAYHGVYDEEAKLGQRFNISLDCAIDLSEAGRTDDLRHGVSYADLAALVQEIAVGERFHILEALGEKIAASVLEQHPRIAAVVVTVEKPAAAIAALFETIEVTIQRSRVRA